MQLTLSLRKGEFVSQFVETPAIQQQKKQQQVLVGCPAPHNKLQGQ